jgi:hypothetical protein
MSALTSHLPQIPTCCQVILCVAAYTGYFAGVGALAGYTFSIIHPVGGAIIGATSYSLAVAGKKIAEVARVEYTELKASAIFYASVCVSIVATTALGGFPVTVLGGASLALALYTSLIVTVKASTNP